MPELLDIIGQDAAVARLQQAMGGSRMPHAFVFVGPAGVGRRTTATALARCLLCDEAAAQPNNGRLEQCRNDTPLRQACGRCRSCKLIDAGSHPDFHLVYTELAHYHEDAAVRDRKMQELSIAVIRSFLLDPAALAAVRGRGKVFVVREAELMSQAAQNALLKTLEEPPAGVIIILIAQRAEQLLPTTLSRCAMIRFRSLPHEFVEAKLAAAGVAAAEARFWAAMTDGSLGRSLRLAEQGMYAVKTDLVRRIAALDATGDAALGQHLTKTTDGLAEAAIKAAKNQDGEPAKRARDDGSGAEEASPKLSKTLASRRAVGIILELLGGAFRDALTLATGADRPIVNSDQAEAVRGLAERFDPTQLAEIIDQLGSYERLLWRNANPRIIWDNVVITAASAAPLRV